jgi:hypothetical protein
VLGFHGKRFHPIDRTDSTTTTRVHRHDQAMPTIRMRGLVLSAVALVLGACSATTSGTPTAATAATARSPFAGTSTSGSVAQPTDGLDHLDLGQGLELSVPGGSATVAPFEQRQSGDCMAAQAQVMTATGTFDLWLVGKGCPQQDQRVLNGNHGRYLEPPSYATEVSTAQQVPAGSLVTFGQTYTECTNSCNDYADAVGLITVAHPQDADLPVLQIVAPRAAEGDVATVVALARSITPTG